MASGDAAVTVLLAEFDSLRSEIESRSHAQQTLSNLALTLSGATVAYALANDAIVVLLLQPIIASALGMLYANHGHHIRRVGRYIERHLAPALADVTSDPRVMWWEKVAHSGRKRLSRQFWLLPPVLMFVGSSASVLAVALAARVFSNVARNSNLLSIPLAVVGVLWFAGLCMVTLAAMAFWMSFRRDALAEFEEALAAAQATSGS